MKLTTIIESERH